jgi:rubrerythrin
MDRTELIERLSFFMRLERDAVRAYERALNGTEAAGVRDNLRQFMREHERHVSDLREAIRQEGNEAPELAEDVQGIFLEALASVERGEQTIFQGLEAGERYVNYKYRQAGGEEFPAHVIRLLERNWADERRHLAYVEGMLKRVGPSRRIARTVGLGALGAAAAAVILVQVAAR